MPTPSLLRASLRALLRRPLQTALMIVGIALGVAVVVAIDLANSSARRGFELSTEAVVGRATHQVRGGPSGVPEDLYRQLRVEWGYTQSAPVVEGIAVAVDLDGQPLRLLGVDPFAEAPFRNYLSGSQSRLPGFERFYTEPGTVLGGAALADRYGLKPGQALRLRVADRLQSVTIVGVLAPQDAGS